jgi:predicted transposase YbfD/YdcC
MLANTRSHWMIENGLHWTLDMSFGEDACRIRKENAPLAIAIIRHVALNLLQAAKQKHQSIKRLRKKAGWDDSTLKKILKIS